MNRKFFQIITFFTLATIFLAACASAGNTKAIATSIVNTATLVALSPTSTATMTIALIPTTPPTMTLAATSSSGTGACVNSAEFVADVSIPDGSSLALDTAFTKTWRVKNTGTCAWDSRYSLIFVDGTLFSAYDRMALPFAVAPGQTIDLSLDMTSPIYPGNYESDWKLQAPDGSKFGVGKKDSPLWIKIAAVSPETTIISGFVYQNLNGNSKYDFDDQLMANREVWLQQGSCEQGGTRLASAQSGSDGRYVITGEYNGAYCVVLQRPDATVYSITVSVSAGQHLDSADMQDAIPNLVISGSVWNDSSQPDGVQQSAEPNLAGVTVLLQIGPCASLPSPNSPVPIAATTDAQGRFSFVSLYGGTYCVSVPTGDGSNLAILGSGAWTTPINGSQQVTLQSGGQPQSVSFGWHY